MPKEEWGVKRVCTNCSTRFYDLGRDPMVCPECGHSFSLESLTNTKSRSLVADKSDAQSTTAAKESTDAEEVDVLDDDDSADIELEDDVLDDDDNDDVSLDEIADVPAEDDE
ncbi:hypothetical protein ACMU_16695 [Actibacterium mucosum KCTC 23349]|uniref:TIGR02300 family protein n=1 Tax=Actibacterium mucosum KCTC 23349 TaxID=1454373 RepID=A0A037ZGK7_9RHOB|nr:TIGR02300 family protein [Actibacterium mucosum]KAJ54753.1 hypothetical protein ACMU_16695 [Actibacterium mucosum KCTC 23349]